MNIYDIYKEYPTEGLKEVPMSVQELKDANADKMEECLLSAGYKFIFKPHDCSDGKEYEIIEIRGPKASGFFCKIFLFFYFASVETRKSNFHTPLHAHGRKVPPHKIHNKTTKNIMQKVQNVFPIYKLENNEKIINLAEDRQQIYCRVAIMPTGTTETLSDEQKALLAKLSDKQRNTTLKGQLEREISNVFPISVFSEYIDGLDEIAKDAEYFSEEGQNEIISQLSDLLKSEKFIFTYYSESIENLLKGTEYDNVKVVYAENANGEIRPIRSRNNLYFGFFENEEEAFAFMQSRLISDIEDENLMLENPNASDDNNKQKAEKPKLQLKRK